MQPAKVILYFLNSNMSEQSAIGRYNYSIRLRLSALLSSLPTNDSLRQAGGGEKGPPTELSSCFGYCREKYSFFFPLSLDYFHFKHSACAKQSLLEYAVKILKLCGYA